MTFAAIKETLDYARSLGTEMGPEAIQEKGLEELFVRAACILQAYADGYQDAGGSLEQLRFRDMDESYAVEINDLLRRCKE